MLPNSAPTAPPSKERVNGHSRKALSATLRFEIFKRDRFTCQYCGGKAPDVVLRVDHINPVANGGTNDLLNLITACFTCNAGKSDRLLDDQSTLAKKREQLALLQERREQLDMMMRWENELLAMDTLAEEEAAEYWSKLVPGYHLNERGRHTLGRMIRKFGITCVLQSMREATDSYLIYERTCQPAPPWKPLGNTSSASAR